MEQRHSGSGYLKTLDPDTQDTLDYDDGFVSKNP